MDFGQSYDHDSLELVNIDRWKATFDDPDHDVALVDDDQVLVKSGTHDRGAGGERLAGVTEMRKGLFLQ